MQAFSPLFACPLSDLLSEVAIEQSKDYSSFAQPNIMLALQVTTNYIMSLRGELQIQLTLLKTCLFNRGDCHRKVQTKENVSAGTKKSGGRG